MDILELVHDDYRLEHRPFQCTFSGCPKAFARRSDLVRHARIHNDERPYSCPIEGCGKSFIQKSACTVHIRTHTGEKPHICDTCDKAFADSSSLARHRRVHSGRRPYRCLVDGCGKSFCRKTTLTKHTRRSHSGVVSAETAKPKRKARANASMSAIPISPSALAMAVRSRAHCVSAPGVTVKPESEADTDSNAGTPDDFGSDCSLDTAPSSPMYSPTQEHTFDPMPMSLPPSFSSLSMLKHPQPLYSSTLPTFATALPSMPHAMETHGEAIQWSQMPPMGASDLDFSQSHGIANRPSRSGSHASFYRTVMYGVSD